MKSEYSPVRRIERKYKEEDRRKREIGLVVDPDSWESLFLALFALLMVTAKIITHIYVPQSTVENTVLFKRLKYNTSCFALDFAPVTLFSSAVYCAALVFAVTAVIMRLARAAGLRKLGKMSYCANLYFWITAILEVLGYCIFSLCLSVQVDQNIYVHVLGFCFFIFATSICGSIRNVIWVNYYGLQRSNIYYKLTYAWYSLYLVISILAVVALATVPFYEVPLLFAITKYIDLAWSVMFFATMLINFFEGYGNGFLKISFEFIDNEHPDFNDDIKFFAHADGHLDEDDVNEYNLDIEENTWNDSVLRYWFVSYFLFFIGLFIMTGTKGYVGCKIVSYLPGWNVLQYFIQLGTVFAGSMMALLYLPSYWRLLHKDQSETERNFSKYFTVCGGFVFALGNGILAFQRLVYHTIPSTSTEAGYGVCTGMQIVGLTYGFSFIYHPNFPKYSWAQRWTYITFVTVVLVSITGRVIGLCTGDFKRYYQGATGCPLTQLFGK